MKRRAPIYVNHMTAAAMVRAIVDGPATIIEIAEETGVAYTTARKYVRALRMQGLVYIASWQPDTRGRLKAAAYSFGGKQDAPPARKPRKLVVQQYLHRRAMRELHQAAAGAIQ